MRTVLLVFGVSFAPFAFAQSPDPELMNRVAAWAARTDPVRAREFKLATTFLELDADGRVEHTTVTTVRVTRTADGRQRTEVLASRKDGEDNLGAARKEQSQREAKQDGKPPKRQPTTPFERDEQPKYRFTLLPPYADDPGRVRIGFAPAGKPSSKLSVGEAKIDPATGAVVWLRQRPSELPMFADALDIEMTFGAPSSEGPLLSVLTISGSGGPPFMKRRGSAVMRFSEYVLAGSPTRVPAAP